jgi:DNA ligase (NAD+)
MSVVVDPEVAELELVIEALDTAFEEGSDCIHPITNKIVSNSEYDQLRKRLQELHPESEKLKAVTASKLSSTAKKVAHNPPFTSISKAIGELADRDATLKKFQAEVTAELKYSDPPEKWLVQAYKRDGVAVALYYEHGKLVRAGLRPRKVQDGEDVTENVQYVEGIPAELWEHDRAGNRIKFLDVTCCIRGELECKKSVFRKIKDNWQDPEYDLDREPANPRNYTAGSIRQFNNPKITKVRKLSFTGYSILGWHAADNSAPPFKTEVERAKYANAVLRVPFVQVRPFRYQDLKVLEDLQGNLDYEVDGVVLSVNNLEDAEQMGNIGGTAYGNPKAKLAWKFSEQSAITKVKDVEWQVGRTGALCPVMRVEPVNLDGTTVTYVTGHSLGFMKGTSKSSLGEISEDAEIRIIKSGKIIPKVIEIVKKGWGSLRIPNHCPSCYKNLDIVKGTDGTELVCNNEFCGVRAVAHFTHYLSTFGVKGVAESALTKMYEAGAVKDVSDLYNLTVPRLENIQGFSKRQVLLAVARIWMCSDPTGMDDDALEKWIKKAQDSKVKVPAWKLFASLGIEGAGKTAGQALIAHFGSFKAVRKASLAELEAVPDIGETTAKAIHGFFQKWKDLIDSLLENVEPEDPKVGKFTGKSFCFTGGFPGGKQKWEQAVMDHGAKVSSSVSKTTSYVVVGSDAGSKEEKAKELGITRLSLADLEKML